MKNYQIYESWPLNYKDINFSSHLQAKNGQQSTFALRQKSEFIHPLIVEGIFFTKCLTRLQIFYMFDDMFDTEEDLLSGQKEGQVQSSWDRQPRNCAHNLTMPDMPRKQGYPIGLKNQGATCYLNSLLQILFHTPELRQTILSLPLCDGSAQKPSGFVGKGQQSFLRGFQKLFSEMSLSDVRAVGTDYLNEAFGWKGAQHMEQQDIQEAMRIIFDTIERALFATQYEQAVRELFRGRTQRYKNCLTCSVEADHEEFFYDLSMQVKDFASLEASLVAFSTPELMDGENRIYCDTCQSKQDMLLGGRLYELPSILVFTLNRFDFDYQKMDRVKIVTNFQYNLELDLNSFLAHPSNPAHHQYQLYGVLIHRGSAHGGHYLSYIRDVLQESDWNKGLQETKEQQAKIREGKAEKEGEKQEEKPASQKPTVKDAENKDLNNGWFEINDNVATAIDVSKLAQQYEGSESAYILFYRRKGINVDKNLLAVPEYFSRPILEVNSKLDTERAAYESQKQHIIVKVKGEAHKLKTSLPINEFIGLFVPQGYALVQENQHNGLPYYPMQFIHHPDITYTPEKTLQSEKVVHESNWQLYQIGSPEYDLIKNVVGVERLPLELILVEGEATKRIVCYNDENFLMLRIKIEKQLKIPYQKQILTLVTPYKQAILTDVSENDDLPLPKLGITHCGQIIIKTLGAQEEADAEESKKQSTTLCFLVERDDVSGLKRIYFERVKSLRELLNFVIASQSLKQGKYRFRNLNGNRLYYLDHYEKTLGQLQFSEEMIKFRLERGQIPIKGDICVKIKLQSLLYKQESITAIEKIFDPNTVLLDVKEWACVSYGLEPSMHKLYLTDWTGEPIRSLTREKTSLFQTNFGREELVCLRDIHSPIGAELVHLEVFSTPTGSPDSVDKESIHIKIEQFKTVGDLKELIIGSIQKLNGLSPSYLRLREIKRDYMFGTIWRDTKKSVKSVTVNTNKIVYQVLNEPEELKDEQVVVILKQRNPEKRIYEQSMELVFDAGRTPSVEELTEAVKNRVGAVETIKIIKYVNYDFEWVEISRDNIEKILKKKKTNQKGGQKKEKNAQPQKKKEKVEEEKNGTTEKQPKAEQPKKQKNKNKNKNEGEKNKPQQVSVQQQKKPKQQKVKKNQVNSPKLNEDCFNLRKAPILLKDGDWIGWGLSSLLEKDDLQTEQDLSLKVIKDKTVYRRNQNGGFKLNVDF